MLGAESQTTVIERALEEHDARPPVALPRPETDSIDELAARSTPALRSEPSHFIAEAPAAPAPASRFSWLVRPRRILLALAAVWTISTFDLGFTLLESSRGHFVEMNPFAAELLSGPTYVIVLYKAALLVTGSTILLVLRRHRAAELACWFLLASYVGLGLRWATYYRNLLNDGTPTVIELAAGFT